MLTRTLLVAASLAGAAVCIDGVSTDDVVQIRRPLAQFPVHLGEWDGARAPDIDEKTLAVLGVDDYLNRMYARPAEAPLGLYVGYYESQHEGDTIHSPLNCLPGAGWEPVKRRLVSIATPPIVEGSPASAGTASRQAAIVVNSVVIQKGMEKVVVLYWYQSHGRIVASEYRAKIYMVLDAARTNRTDGALLRVTSPIAGFDEAAERTAEQRAIDFARTVFPLLGHYLPA